MLSVTQKGLSIMEACMAAGRRGVQTQRVATFFGFLIYVARVLPNHKFKNLCLMSHQFPD